MTEAKQSKSRVRRWLDKRRESQRRGAEIGARAKAARKAEQGRHEGPGGSGTSGPVGGV
jgi:hypothetical protein